MKFHERQCRSQPCDSLHAYRCPRCDAMFYVNSRTHYDNDHWINVSPYYPTCSMDCYDRTYGFLVDPNRIRNDPQFEDLVTIIAAYDLLQTKINLEE